MTKLALDGVDVPVALGCSEEERSNLQTILVDLVFAFIEMPKCCQTDKLDGTLCYAKLITKIHNFCKDREFATIEYLGTEIYEMLKEELPKKIELFLRIRKPQPLMGLKYSIFTVGDFLENSL